MEISNGLGYDILLSGVKITTSDGTVYGDYSLETPEKEIGQGTSKIVEMDLDGIKKLKGEVERMKVSITYVSCAPEVNYNCASTTAPEHTISGRIVARMEEKE